MWHKLTLNVFGGFLASFVFAGFVLLMQWSQRKVHAWKFKQIFGLSPFREEFFLIYDELAPENYPGEYSFSKPEGNPGIRIRTSRAVPLCTGRAVGYLSAAIGAVSHVTPEIKSDMDVKAQLDLDFISFGGPEVNHKTKDCQSNSGNELARWCLSKRTFVNLRTDKPLVRIDPNFDYGLILKVRSSQFSSRVWMACVGLGEWGTSGSAWFLANKWDQIRKKAKNRPFAAVVRVDKGKDESAEIVELSY